MQRLYLVQEQQPLLLSAFLERFRIKFRQHGCDTHPGSREEWVLHSLTAKKS